MPFNFDFDISEIRMCIKDQIFTWKIELGLTKMLSLVPRPAVTLNIFWMRLTLKSRCPEATAPRTCKSNIIRQLVCSDFLFENQIDFKVT